jgi:hypothetical protein
MMRCRAEDECDCLIEVHGFSWEEERSMVLARLHHAFAASGCWTIRYSRRSRRALEYSFEVELDAAMELYCGLVGAGLELTDVSHRALTELCLLRSHERVLRSHERPGTERTVNLRLIVGFVASDDEVELGDVIAALA